MKTIVLASGNAHKKEEFSRMLPGVEVLTLKDFPPIDIVEDGNTFEENALIKARRVHEVTKMAVIADDSGLEVAALDGAPGVYSARWMGEDTSYEIKNARLIALTEGKDPAARYVCCIAWVDKDGNEKTYIGTMEGMIARQPAGDNGFGYDPVFYVPEAGMTAAQMSGEDKDVLSHRGKALRAFLEDAHGQFGVV